MADEPSCAERHLHRDSLAAGIVMSATTVLALCSMPCLRSARHSESRLGALMRATAHSSELLAVSVQKALSATTMEMRPKAGTDAQEYSGSAVRVRL
jgi:hypothetical protein